METVTRTIDCPTCGSPAAIAAHRYRDADDGTVRGVDFEFLCRRGHQPPQLVLARLWAG